MHNHDKALSIFHEGTVIPATPLALDNNRKYDEKSQRVMMRYYLAAGSGGIATAVHSTQFAIRKPEIGLFEPVIRLVSEEIDSFEAKSGKTIVKVCGACGPTEQAVSEAKLAKHYGYDAILLSPGGLNDYSEEYLLERTRSVAEILPVVGFYLQKAVGGRVFSFEYWAKLTEIPNVIGIKCASFNRYTTVDVLRAVAFSSRREEITLYTGNDDNIVNDLFSTYSAGGHIVWFKGGLLGHWCVWTQKAVELFESVRKARMENVIPPVLFALGTAVTEMNNAVFDARNNFAGCIPGMHEVLRRQGLMQNTYCLNPSEKLSPGQKEEIARVSSWYPDLTDDVFVKEHLNEWREE